MPDTLPDAVNADEVSTVPESQRTVNDAPADPPELVANTLPDLPPLEAAHENVSVSLDVAVPPQDAPKKRGRRPGQKNRPKTPSAEALAENAPQIDEALAISAMATVDSITSVMTSLVGGEWATPKEERDNLIAVTAAYYKSKGMTDIPPGAMMVIVWGGYCAARFQHENTREKLFGFARRAYGTVRGFVAKYLW